MYRNKSSSRLPFGASACVRCQETEVNTSDIEESCHMQAEAEPAAIPQEAVNAEVTKMIENGAADNMLGITESTQQR